MTLYGNELTSLQGCPENVKENFLCQVNKLTNLKGGPKTVGGRYDVSDNELTSLEGLPKNLMFISVSHNYDLFDPMGLKDVSIEIGCNLSETRIEYLGKQFRHDGMTDFVSIVQNFIPSLDYGYFRMVKGKPCLIEHRLLDALDEFGFSNYDKSGLSRIGYNIVDENLDPI